MLILPFYHSTLLSSIAFCGVVKLSTVLFTLVETSYVRVSLHFGFLIGSWAKLNRLSLSYLQSTRGRTGTFHIPTIRSARTDGSVSVGRRAG